MQSKNNLGSRSDDPFAPRDDAESRALSHDPNGIAEPISLDLRSEFKAWRRANRMLSRHWMIAEQLGGRALRSARWERGMVMLRGIHIEIAHRKL